jgi:hypothetical protein
MTHTILSLSNLVASLVCILSHFYERCRTKSIFTLTSNSSPLHFVFSIYFLRSSLSSLFCVLPYLLFTLKVFSERHRTKSIFTLQCIDLAKQNSSINTRFHFYYMVKSHNMEILTAFRAYSLIDKSIGVARYNGKQKQVEERICSNFFIFQIS